MLKETCLANLLRDAGDTTSQERQGNYLKVFISWSGQNSRDIAHQLGKWLPFIIQAIRPFVSSGNILKGARWSDVLAEELKETQYGIICITRQNRVCPWLSFEAGAISKMIGQSYVSPLLFDVAPSKLQGPLSQFQATMFDEQGEDIFHLVSSINSILPYWQQVSPDVLRTTFNKWWPDFKTDLKEAANNKTKETETGYRWLYSVADLISLEDDEKLKSVWVINPAPMKDWSILKPTMQKNMKNGVEYEFIVPSNLVSEFTEFVKNDIKHAPGNGDNRLIPEKLSISCVDPGGFKSLAVTHYRILYSGGDKQILFEVPIGPCGYWVKTEGEAVEGFYIRFSKMKDSARTKRLSEVLQPEKGPDASPQT